MKRTALHHFQRCTMSDADIMRGLVEDKHSYQDIGGMLPEEVRDRQKLMACLVDYDALEGEDNDV